MCWTGEHLLPKTGKEKRLPTTATAQSKAAMANFFVLVLFIFNFSFEQIRKRQLSAALPETDAVGLMETARKFGRCLLASSHAGTRLPIAELQDSGRSPSVRHTCGFLYPLSQRIKNRRIPFVVSSCNRTKAFPTAALSTSGIRVEGCTFLSACLTGSPAF